MAKSPMRDMFQTQPEAQARCVETRALPNVDTCRVVREKKNGKDVWVAETTFKLRLQKTAKKKAAGK